MGNLESAFAVVSIASAVLRALLPWLIAKAPKVARVVEVSLEILPDVFGALQKSTGKKPVTSLAK